MVVRGLCHTHPDTSPNHNHKSFRMVLLSAPGQSQPDVKYPPSQVIFAIRGMTAWLVDQAQKDGERFVSVVPGISWGRCCLLLCVTVGTTSTCGAYRYTDYSVFSDRDSDHRQIDDATFLDALAADGHRGRSSPNTNASCCRSRLAR